MKCLVCGKTYEAAECPRCGFPDVQIPGDQAQVLESLKPTIDEYRENFLKRVQLRLVTYRWTDGGGVVALDREELIPVGSGEELLQGIKWLPEKFARIADQSQITVTLRAAAGEEIRELRVLVPNLQRPELQQLGVSMDQDGNVWVMLRNDTDEPVGSAPVPLFA